MSVEAEVWAADKLVPQKKNKKEEEDLKRKTLSRANILSIFREKETKSGQMFPALLPFLGVMRKGF